MSTAASASPKPDLATRTIVTALLPRERRRRLLESLAASLVTGAGKPPSPEAVEVQVAAWSAPSLTAAEAIGKWDDYETEYRRWQAWQDDDPEYRTLPGRYEAAKRAALNDLLDGTATSGEPAVNLEARPGRCRTRAEIAEAARRLERSWPPPSPAAARRIASAEAAAAGTNMRGNGAS